MYVLWCIKLLWNFCISLSKDESSYYFRFPEPAVIPKSLTTEADVPKSLNTEMVVPKSLNTEMAVPKSLNNKVIPKALNTETAVPKSLNNKVIPKALNAGMKQSASRGKSQGRLTRK